MCREEIMGGGRVEGTTESNEREHRGRSLVSPLDTLHNPVLSTIDTDQLQSKDERERKEERNAPDSHEEPHDIRLLLLVELGNVLVGSPAKQDNPQVRQQREGGEERRRMSVTTARGVGGSDVHLDELLVGL